MVLRPVGPLPPGAYWFRRLFVLIIVLVAVAVVWWLLPLGPSDDAESAAAPTNSATEPTTSPSTPKSSPKPSKTTTKPQPTTTVTACGERDIEVSVTTDAETYTGAEFPTFTLAVENVSEDTCARDIGAPALELRVSSGGSKVWSSDDCNPGGEPKVKSLDPGDRFVQSVQWEKVVSQDECPTPAESAQPGNYQVLARNLEIFSDPVPFVLQ